MSPSERQRSSSRRSFHLAASAFPFLTAVSAALLRGRPITACVLHHGGAARCGVAPKWAQQTTPQPNQDPFPSRGPSPSFPSPARVTRSATRQRNCRSGPFDKSCCKLCRRLPNCFLSNCITTLYALSSPRPRRADQGGHSHRVLSAH